MPEPANLELALRLAALGWHILPLTPASKRPLGNCPRCTARSGMPAHRPEDCPCLPAGRWCHGVRAATTDPAVINAWWRAEPHAVPGAAAGPSGLVLLDIDAHQAPLPADLATGLLPGINLDVEPLESAAWDHAGYRDGRDALQLLARLRGGPHPWPSDPSCRPVSTVTPSGGAHLWYQAPARGLCQALADPAGRHGLAWQVDVKAGWSYGIAPGAITPNGTYRLRRSTVARPGRMPDWLAREISRVCTLTHSSPPTLPTSAPGAGPGPAAYLTTVVNRGAAELAVMKDGRKRALAKLAYHAGGLLAWSGLDRTDITNQLTAAGNAAGLKPGDAARIASRAIANGITRPITPPADHR